MHVGLGGRVPHEVGEEALDQAVLTDDALGPLDAGRRQDRLLVLAALDEPVGLEALQHLAGRARETPSISATREAIAFDAVAGRYSPIGNARK